MRKQTHSISPLTLNVKASHYICLHYESLNLERHIRGYRTNHFLQGEASVALSAVKRSFLCLSFSLPTVTFLCCSLCSAIERPPTFLCVCLITNLITNEAEHLSVDPLAISPDLWSICLRFSCIHTHVFTGVMERSSQSVQPRFVNGALASKGHKEKP